MIAGDGVNFDLSQGMLITSQSKTYLQLGNIVNFTDEEIEKIIVYYKKNNTYIEINEIKDSNQMTITISDNIELLNKKDIIDLLENLYIKIPTVMIDCRGTGFYKNAIRINHSKTFIFIEDYYLVEPVDLYITINNPIN